MSRHAAARIGRFARCVFCLVTVLAATNTLASTLRPLNLEQLTARAGQIFVGRCVAVDVERDEALGAEVAVLTFRVEVALKGAAQGTVSVRQVGGEQARIVGLPQIEPGEVVLLFLYGSSQAGLSSPVGFGQGTFTVLPDKTGRRFMPHPARPSSADRLPRWTRSSNAARHKAASPASSRPRAPATPPRWIRC